MREAFRALVVERAGDAVSLNERVLTSEDLHSGDVTIRVHYSSVNYKDSLAVRADGRVALRYPLVPGIDLAGEVLQSDNPGFRAGDQVLAHGYDLGVSHHGGYSEIARVPAEWAVRLPAGITAREAMAIGTAGFTAALAIVQMERMGLEPGAGPVLVTGASGGVGSVAVDLLASRGYHVVASTGSGDAHDYLRGLGARELLDRSETTAVSARPLEAGRWAGAVDAVGGPALSYLLRTISYGGSIASCGNTGGAAMETTVFPFILRAVNVLGIDSVQVPIDTRRELWRRLATDLRPRHLDEIIAREITLQDLPEALETIRRGGVRGRVVVRLSG